MKDAPDFGFITSSIISNYNETSVIYTSLILLGLLAMYYVSSYTVIERDKAHKLYIEEREKLVEEQTAHQKEFLFTKRIYHTHHKAEKVMAFVKEDLRLLTANNIDEIKYRISKYSNFISRVIYDMKWFDPPVQVFRGPRFNTSINEVIEFIVKNMFLRTSRPASNFSFKLEFDEGLPNVQINEFVIWEIVEPLIQNSIDHCGESHVTITLKTEFDLTSRESRVVVTDDGKGIDAELLERNAEGDQKLFMENVTTKKISGQNFGYGCYIAYDLATTRCGWKMFAENLPGRGCRFVIIIKN
jgi:light-regulated signal transduction histidine kinase (bacteriophytochrome)